jgi:hypothetical protein
MFESDDVSVRLELSPLLVTYEVDDVSVRLVDVASLETFESAVELIAVEFEERSARHAGGGVGRSLMAIVHQLFNSGRACDLR